MTSLDPVESAASGRSGLTVDFMPFNRENVYWANLARHLERLGVGVGECGMLKEMQSRVRHGGRVPDVLHMHWMPRWEWTAAGVRRLPLFLMCLRRLRRSGLGIVWTAHDLYYPEVIWKRADRWVTRQAIRIVDRVIAHSARARELVCREFDVRDRAKVRVIPHGHYIGSYPDSMTRSEARASLGLRNDEFVFGILGHLRPYKGLLDLVDAFGRIEGRARLVIAGKPLNEETVATLTRRVAVDPRIVLHAGFVADADVQRYMKAADVVVIPYRQGLTSGAVVLAMSFGRPCVAADLGCTPDFIDPRGGFLFPAGDPVGLHEAMVRAMGQGGALEAMGDYNLGRAREWSWESVARATRDVYRESAAKGRARA